MQTGTRVEKKAKEKLALIVIFTLLILVLIGVCAYAYHILSYDMFYAGISVDGIPLSGMTKQEGLSTIKALNQPDLDKMKISLEHDGKIWVYDHIALDASVNAEEIVDEAYSIGREGNWLGRLADIFKTTKEGREFQTTMTYDVSKLRDELEVIAGEINIEPVDATIYFDPDREEKFAFTPHKVGKGMLVDRAIEDLEKRVKSGDFSTYEIPVEDLHPEYTLEEVQTWTDRIAHYSTKLTNNSNRTYNIELSSKSYDGIRVNPGETFSFNEATGPRDAAHGYKDAPVIVGGKKLEDEPGGGNCQSSSTLYAAVIRADLEIVERQPHSFPSSYIDVGQDATVNYPYADFKFKNNKDTPIFINRYFANGSIHVEIYGKSPTEYDKIDVITNIISRTEIPPEIIEEDPELYEGEEVVEYKSRQGIKAETYRVYYKDGKEIQREKEAYSNYPKIVGLKRVGTKKPLDEESDIDDLRKAELQEELEEELEEESNEND